MAKKGKIRKDLTPQEDIGLIYKTVYRYPDTNLRNRILLMLAILSNKIK